MYTSNLIYRNRTTFYFFKSYLNGVFCDNANQIILTCWIHSFRRSLFVMLNECAHRVKGSDV